MNDILNNKNFRGTALIFLVIVTLYFGALMVNAIKENKYIGAGQSESNTISVQGKGEIFVVPDIATVTFSVRANAKTLKDAQASVTEKTAKIMAFLEEKGIDEKDIKTTNYNSYPQYENTNEIVCMGIGCPRPNPNPKVIGYELNQSFSVKIRNADTTNEIIEGLGTIGVADMSGAQFSIDDEEKVNAEARRKAIADAKEKADVLAKDLGVRLVRIVSFNESGNYPMYYSKASMDGAENAAPDAPQIPMGENQIVSNVTIVYEIQ